MKPHLPLHALQAFAAVMRAGSMGRAAAELHVTHGAVSRQVARLQTLIGRPLFEGPRNARRPTAEAERLWREIEPAFAILDGAMNAHAPRGRKVRVSCLSTVATRWLIPRLPRFAALWPDIVVELSESYAALDLSLEGADVAIRMSGAGASTPSGLVATSFMANAVGLIVAPGLNDWTGRARLVSRSHPSAWEDWSVRVGHAPPTDRPIAFDHQQTMLEAAIAGLGSAIALAALVEADIAEGRLVAPFGFVEDGATYAAFTRAGEAPLAVRRFVAWLVDEGGKVVSSPSQDAEGDREAVEGLSPLARA